MTDGVLRHGPEHAKACVEHDDRASVELNKARLVSQIKSARGAVRSSKPSSNLFRERTPPPAIKLDEMEVLLSSGDVVDPLG